MVANDAEYYCMSPSTICARVNYIGLHDWAFQPHTVKPLHPLGHFHSRDTSTQEKNSKSPLNQLPLLKVHLCLGDNSSGPEGVP